MEKSQSKTKKLDNEKSGKDFKASENSKTKNKESDENRRYGSRTSSICCRICQLSSGKLIQPCACKGTMGRIHNTCLNNWMNTSGNQYCELCHQNYRIQGTCFKPLKKWTSPQVSRQEVISFTASACVIAWFTYCLYYLSMLLIERDVHARIQNPETNISPSDFTVIFLIVLCCLGIIPETVGLCQDLFKGIKGYIDSQMIRMILSANEDKQTNA